MTRTACLLLALALTASRAVAAPGASPAPLQSFTLKDYLQHQWSDELVHFPFSYSATSLPQSLTLTDTQGQALPTQIAGLTCRNGKITGTAWTVVSLPPKAALTLQLRPARRRLPRYAWSARLPAWC